MGFCRRCGDIVTGTRCKCGGTAVAPVVPWNQSNTLEQATDRWSKTYVHRERSVSPTRSVVTHTTGSTNVPPPSSSPTKRFPRPLSSYITQKHDLGNTVAAHIASTTSQSNRPPSPLKHSTTLPAPESDILPSLVPGDNTLAKVYGSVLQPKESLKTHSCAICASPFPPDATIYPDPNAVNSSRFLCRPCFTTNGGSKGACPTCSRPVLTLKSEGGFVHAGDYYWHKRCFNCSGCFKNIGDSPMLDLLGRPSCVDCFDTCLNREPSTPKKVLNNYNSPRNEKTTNIGGMRVDSMGRKVREGSPAVEELEERLGISKSRGGSPALEELSQRLSMIGRDAASKNSLSGDGQVNGRSSRYSASREGTPGADHSRGRRNSRPENISSPTYRYQSKGADNDSFQMRTTAGASATSSPVRRQVTGSPAPTQAAIEEMKQRFIKGSPYSPSTAKAPTPVESPTARRRPLRHSRSSASLRDAKILAPAFQDGSPSPQSPAPLTPDFMSDFSDTTTLSSFSGPDSPPRYQGTSNVYTKPDVFSEGYGSSYVQGDLLSDSDQSIVEPRADRIKAPSRIPRSIIASDDLTNTSVKRSAVPTSPPPSTRSAKPMAPKPHGQLTPPSTELSASTCCAGCNGHLFSAREGGKFVTVPGGDETAEPKRYHINCFRCAICRGVFKDANTGQAVFVRSSDGPCHAECAPATKITIHKTPSLGSLRPRSGSGVSPSVCVPTSKPATVSTNASSSRIDRLPLSIPSTTPSFPRFGSRAACPGCNNSVSPMERGVVPGPQGTRWHASCLVCGGKKAVVRDWRGRIERKAGEPGCGKQLDSAAKSSGDGGVWCRECLLLLGIAGSPQASPARAPLVPTYTGSNKVLPQLTGTTTIARQFTGLGGGKDISILRQLTGGGPSPARSTSPTKQLGGGGRPRPKSVIGMRTNEEGRGMFLVRQLTGASGWGDSS